LLSFGFFLFPFFFKAISPILSLIAPWSVVEITKVVPEKKKLINHDQHMKFELFPSEKEVFKYADMLATVQGTPVLVAIL